MPFHVEIKSSPDHARVFNISEAELQQILGLWVSGQTFELGEQSWDSRESKLTILEGKLLEGPDLAFGQGWSNALRSAEDVTRERMEAAEVAAPLPTIVAVEADSVDAAAAKLASGDGEPIGWPEAQGRIDGRDPAVAAVIIVLRPAGPDSSRS